MKPALLLATLALCVGCAPAGAPRPAGKSAESAPAGHAKVSAWHIEELAAVTQPYVLLHTSAGTPMAMETARARLIRDTAKKVVAAAGAGETPDWLLVGSSSVNAFASYQKGQPVIGITLGMVELLQDDVGAWGALIGHELAHFRLGHHDARRSRQEAVKIGSTLAGIALSIAGVGFGNTAADAAGVLVERAFSREDESDADRAGLDYARRSGLDPAGALRLQQRLLDVKGEAGFGFLSTHPGGKERVETIRQLLDGPAAGGK